jgi:hypothetical protein
MAEIIGSMIGFNNIPESARQRFCGIGQIQAGTIFGV